MRLTLRIMYFSASSSGIDSAFLSRPRSHARSVFGRSIVSSTAPRSQLLAQYRSTSVCKPICSKSSPAMRSMSARSAFSRPSSAFLSIFFALASLPARISRFASFIALSSIIRLCLKYASHFARNRHWLNRQSFTASGYLSASDSQPLRLSSMPGFSAGSVCQFSSSPSILSATSLAGREGKYRRE